MAFVALALLAAGLVLMIATGWPSYAVLLAVACAIAGAGTAAGAIDPALLGALPSRLVALLEHDLLQAVALYAFVGALLRELDLVSAVAGGFERALRPLPPGPRRALAGYGLGLLAAPMNGSVGASVALLGHAVAPRWRGAGLAPARATALTAATATLGAIVPPSLVLLLLGDALMRAHTEGLQIANRHDLRIVNTQDLVQACAPVALLLAVAWAAVAAWQARAARAQAPPPPRRTAAWVAPLAVAVLLGGVALGRFRAVEAAATAALMLFAWAALTGRLRGGAFGRVLDDALALSGALFALLVAASTLSLMLRAAGCDHLVLRALSATAGHPGGSVALVMGGLLLAGFVLDAFELVFLVVPLVMPVLLSQVDDAAWVGVLTLLVLQAGFLLPPWGYAVVLARATTPGVGLRELARALAPYLAVLAGVAALVAAVPAVTHVWRTVPDRIETTPGAPDADDLLRGMSQPRGN